jgi:hypothetical protein
MGPRASYGSGFGYSAVLSVKRTTLRAASGSPLALVVADELPSVLLMVGYTWAGLFLLFADCG